MDNNVVKVAIEASVAGVELDVHEATISLGINAIPTVELSCAPSEANRYKINTFRPKIADFNDLYIKLKDKAWGKDKTCDVKFTITTDGPRSGRDSISLNGWILTGVGMSGVSSTSAPYLTVILQHKICWLTKVGSVYETPKSDEDCEINDATRNCSDIIDALLSVYDCVKNKIDYWPAPNEVAENYRMSLGTDEFDPRKYLKWKGENGIYLAVEGGKDMKAELSMAIGRALIPDENGTSTWDVLVDAAGSLLLNIVQDQDNNFTKDTLLIEASRPWKAAEITIYDDECHWTELPGMDPFRIAGIMCRRLGPGSFSMNQGTYRGGNPMVDPPDGEVMYTPEPMESPKLADGRIMKIPSPSILEGAFARDAPHGDDIPGSEEDGEEEVQTGFKDVLTRYCRAVYENTAASRSCARLQRKLGFRDKNGKLILPGNTCVFKSDGKDIYYGYINNVVHHISISGGCGTAVAMSRVRSTPDFKINGQTAIAYDSKNPAYD